MEFRFLGGASEIGSTGLLLKTDDFSGVFEYGLTPTSPPQYPSEAPPIDYFFLSHAHLDHSGMAPWLTSKYEPDLYATDLTLDLSRVLLRDNLKICDIEGFPSMYSKSNIREMMDSVIEVEYGSKYDLKNSNLTIYSAGHIPGAVMFLVGLNNGKKILFTGDINTIDTRLVSGCKGVKCDILIMEATYAGRDHELRQKIEYTFQEKVKEIIENGGKAIIPSFAVGRTQEVLLILADLDFEIWLDGMGGDVTRLILQYPELLKDYKKLRKIFEKVHRVRSQSQRRKAMEGEVIVTTSGMLDGGPVLTYIKELNNKSKNGILLTGYQVEGTNGRSLLEKGIMKIDSSSVKINMDIHHFDFSAHAGHKELLKFVRSCNPEHVLLFHGDNRDLLSQDLENEYNLHLLKNNESLEL